MTEPLDLLCEGVPAARRVGAGLEQPEAPHARAAQDLAGLRRARESLAEFLARADFLREVVPAAEAPADAEPV